MDSDDANDGDGSSDDALGDDSSDDSSGDDCSDDDGSDVYIVDRIIASRTSASGVEYLCQWEGWIGHDS